MVALLPDAAAGHFNLGLALGRLGPAHLQDTIAELEKAHQMAPDFPGVNNALCWRYALMWRPEKAMPFCDRAVELDPSGASHDSRGVARAQLEDIEGATADFQYFLDHYHPGNSEAAKRLMTTRRAWLRALQAGENPFDAATLADLARE